MKKSRVQLLAQRFQQKPDNDVPDLEELKRRRKTAKIAAASHGSAPPPAEDTAAHHAQTRAEPPAAHPASLPSTPPVRGGKKEPAAPAPHPPVKMIPLEEFDDDDPTLVEEIVFQR